MEIYITSSIGISISGIHGDDEETLFRYADSLCIMLKHWEEIIIPLEFENLLRETKLYGK